MNKKVESDSRVTRSIINTLYGILSYVFILLATFVGRRVFADKLGAEFLGLNNYFSSIVSMLSLTELGVGTAMIFFLYEPIGLGDKERIKSLLKFYKNVYAAIGIAITILGGIVTIFIGKIVDSTLPLSEVRLYFMMFLLGTSITYFWAHKRNLLFADQKSSIVSITRTLSKIAVIVLQTIVLLLTGSFLLYLIIIIIGNMADNIMCSIIVNKRYPYTTDKEVTSITKQHKKQLFKKIVPIFTYNIADYAVTSVPTMVISAVSLVSSGVYSNYILITSTLRGILGSIFASFTYSFGNLAVTESKERCYEVFKKIDFLAFWIVSSCTVIYISMIQPFIALWMGDAYQLSFFEGVLIGINFYLVMMNVPAVSVQNALGLHKHDQPASIAYAVIVVILSLTLGINFGIVGIVLSSIISVLLFPTISKPYVIYKHLFKVSPSAYYIEFVKRFAVFAIMAAITAYTSELIFPSVSIGNFVLRGIYSFIVPTVMLLLLYRKTEYFSYYLSLAKRYIYKNR